MLPATKLFIVAGKQASRPLANRTVMLAESSDTLRRALLQIGSLEFSCRQFAARNEFNNDADAAAEQGLSTSGGADNKSAAADAASVVDKSTVFRKARKIDILGVLRRQQHVALPRPTDKALIASGAKFLVEFIAFSLMAIFVFYESGASSRAAEAKNRKTAERLVALQEEVAELDARVTELHTGKKAAAGSRTQQQPPAVDAEKAVAVEKPHGVLAAAIHGGAAAEEEESPEAVFDRRAKKHRDQREGSAAPDTDVAGAVWRRCVGVESGVETRAAMALAAWSASCAILASIVVTACRS